MRHGVWPASRPSRRLLVLQWLDHAVEHQAVSDRERRPGAVLDRRVDLAMAVPGHAEKMNLCQLTLFSEPGH
jgi:hypothetical protein